MMLFIFAISRYKRSGSNEKQPPYKPSEEYQNFEKLAKQLIAVPKSEIYKREAEYQRHKKTTRKRKAA